MNVFEYFTMQCSQVIFDVNRVNPVECLATVRVTSVGRLGDEYNFIKINCIIEGPYSHIDHCFPKHCDQRSAKRDIPKSTYTQL